MSIGTLLTGFSLGITVGFISLIPGGLGFRKVRWPVFMACLAYPSGLPLLAAILFRIVYYFIPFLASLGFYRRFCKSMILMSAELEHSANGKTYPDQVDRATLVSYEALFPGRLEL